MLRGRAAALEALRAARSTFIPKATTGAALGTFAPKTTTPFVAKTSTATSDKLGAFKSVGFLQQEHPRHFSLSASNGDSFDIEDPAQQYFRMAKEILLRKITDGLLTNDHAAITQALNSFSRIENNAIQEKIKTVSSSNLSILYDLIYGEKKDPLVAIRFIAQSSEKEGYIFLREISSTTRSKMLLMALANQYKYPESKTFDDFCNHFLRFLNSINPEDEILRKETLLLIKALNESYKIIHNSDAVTSAVTDRNINVLEILGMANVDFNCIDPELGFPPLYAALLLANTEELSNDDKAKDVVENLLKFGAKTDFISDANHNLLSMALMTKKTHSRYTLTTLAKTIPNIAEIDSNGLPALIYIPRTPFCFELLDILLARGVDINCEAKAPSKEEGTTILHNISQLNVEKYPWAPDLLKYSIKKGADVNKKRTSDGLSVFATAILSKNFEMADILLEAGANLEDKITLKTKNEGGLYEEIEELPLSELLKRINDEEMIEYLKEKKLEKSKIPESSITDLREKPKPFSAGVFKG